VTVRPSGISVASPLTMICMVRLNPRCRDAL
jgi:hypothetical protein